LATKEILITVTSPRFCAGLVLQNGIIVDAAPIIEYLIGMKGIEAARYCLDRHWDWWHKGQGVPYRDRWAKARRRIP